MPKNSTPTKNKSWFPVKRYGWGWGMPKVWQGWVVLVGCLGIGLAPLLYVSTMYKGDTYCKEILSQGINVSCNPDAATSLYVWAAILWLIGWVLVLVQIASSKGDKPSWHWGKKGKKAVKKHATKS